MRARARNSVFARACARVCVLKRVEIAKSIARNAAFARACARVCALDRGEIVKSIAQNVRFLAKMKKNSPPLLRAFFAGNPMKILVISAGFQKEATSTMI